MAKFQDQSSFFFGTLLPSEQKFLKELIEKRLKRVLTSIMGYAITGQSLSELCSHAKGFSDEELLDPAVAFYAWKYLNIAKKAGKDYFYNYLIDMEQRRDSHVKTLEEDTCGN